MHVRGCTNIHAVAPGLLPSLEHFPTSAKLRTNAALCARVQPTCKLSLLTHYQQATTAIN